MLIDVIDIIEEVVLSIDNSLSFTVSGNTLVTCNTSYVAKGYIITIGLEDYEVVSVDRDSLITLDRVVTDDTVNNTTIQPVKFRHGTISSVGVELSKDLSKPSHENYPLIFLLEEISVDYDRYSTPYATSLMKLFFVGQTDYRNYTIDDHHSNTVNPLKGLVNKFMESAYLSNNIVGESLNQFTTNLHPILGFTDEEGYTNNYLKDNLSSIQLTVNMPFYGNNKCCKN